MSVQYCSVCKHLLSERDRLTYGERCEDCWSSVPARGVSACRAAAGMVGDEDEEVKLITNQAEKKTDSEDE